MLLGGADQRACVCSKESANCRLELNYGQQNDHVDLIPLMMEANYRPRGWLGLIMGTRLYYKFFGKKLEEESAFEGQMDMLVREIGDRGKVGLSEAVPPTASSTPRGRAPAPAPAPEPARAPPRAPAPRDASLRALAALHGELCDACIFQ